MEFKLYAKVAAILAVTSVIVWAISYADLPKISVADGSRTGAQNYSASGTVSGISTSTQMISISNASASDGDSASDFFFSLAEVEKIQASDYTELSMDDVMPGDMVVVQGLENKGTVTITRVIDFSWDASRGLSSVASSTIASTTDNVASSTTSSMVIATSTSDDVASSTLEGSTDNVSTSTVATSTTATSTDTVATSTPPSDSPPASPPVSPPGSGSSADYSGDGSGSSANP